MAVNTTKLASCVHLHCCLKTNANAPTASKRAKTSSKKFVCGCCIAHLENNRTSRVLQLSFVSRIVIMIRNVVDFTDNLLNKCTNKHLRPQVLQNKISFCFLERRRLRRLTAERSYEVTQAVLCRRAIHARLLDKLQQIKT